MIYHYILVDHKPVPCDDLMTWAQWIAEEDRHVGLTEFEDGTYVSTVFMGLDHRFGPGPPLLFETMIGRHNRVTNANAWEPHQWRYSTWDEAEAGHKAAVKMVGLRIQYTKASVTKS